LFSRVRHKKESVFLVASVILGVILNNLLKTLFARIRPDISPLMDLHSYSYPSGHAMNAFIFYGLLAYYLIVFTKRKTLEVITAVVSIVTILLVGISRVYLGVHYPTDVIAGYIAGMCVVVTAIIVTSRFYQSGD
jgi:undecaprenyl-diphosphatase